MANSFSLNRYDLSILSQLFLSICNGFSAISFHIFFFVVALLGIHYSISLAFFLYITVFAIHYCTLNGIYVSIGNSQEGQDKAEMAASNEVEQETRKQKEVSWRKRKQVILFIAIITSIFIILVQFANFIQPIMGIVEKYGDWESQAGIKAVLQACQAMAIWLGVFHSSDPQYNSYFYDIIGFVIIIYMCVLELRCTDWAERQMGFEFVREAEEKPKDKGEEKKEVEIAPTIVDKADKKHILARIWTIVNVVLEHVILATVLFSSVSKNNIMELLLLPIAFIAAISGIYKTTTLYISFYTFTLFTLQYLMCVINMTTDTTPQNFNDAIFRKVFHLRYWPVYRYILTDFWTPQQGWAYYFTMGNNKLTAHQFITDIICAFIQVIYFQFFSHSSYSLTFVKKSLARRGSTVLNQKPASKNKSLHNACKLMEQVCIEYAHIPTLFLLIFLSSFAGGILTFIYMGFCLIFLNSATGGKNWTLPKYIRFLLVPYVLLDVTVQLGFQINYFQNKPLKDLEYIGIIDSTKEPMQILAKIAVFALIIYQCKIFKSDQYVDIREEGHTNHALVLFFSPDNYPGPACVYPFLEHK